MGRLTIALMLLAGCSSTTAHPPPGPLTPSANVGFFYHPPTDSSQEARIVSDVSWLSLHRDDAPTRDALVAKGYAAPVFMYLLAMQTAPDHWDNNALWGDNPDPSNPNSSYFDDALQQHPDWFLRDQYGQPIKTDYYWMDPGSEGWRQFLAAQAKSALNDGWGGLFLDNVVVTFKRPLRDAAENSKPDGTDRGDPVPWDHTHDRPYTNESFGDSVASLVRTVHQTAALPTGKPVWANLTDPTTAYPDQRHKYLPFLEGWMDEGFASTFEDTSYPSVDQWNTMISRADLAPVLGKSQILVGQGKKGDSDLERFAFASMMLVENTSTYFRYAHTSEYRSLWWYPEYSLKFGTPKGARHQNADGAWRRDFANGYVEVNPDSHDVTMVVDGQKV
jgi:hypothetical protein